MTTHLVAATLALDSLTAAEAFVLVRAPYDRPRRFGRVDKVFVDRLVAPDRGLLEECPDQPGLFRCTERGEAARSAFVAAVWAVVPS